MKKVLFSVVAAGLLVTSCGNKAAASSAEASTEQQTEQAEASVPEGYKTHEFAHFSVSLPEEFTTSYDASSDNVTFSSEAMLKLDNGEEVSSSANVNCGFLADGAKPNQIKETAASMKASQEATGETCDEPIIDGNIILMRHWYDPGEGYKVITWRWWIVSEDGKNVAGNIYFPDSQAKFYDDVAKKIVKSIKIK